MELPTDADWRLGNDSAEPMGSRNVVWGTKTGKIGQLIYAGLLRGFEAEMDRPRMLDHYVVVYTLQGPCQYTLADGTIRLVEAGELFFLFPGVPHQYGSSPGKRWSQLFVAFKGSSFEMWQRRGILDPDRMFFPLKPVEYWINRFRSVIRSVPSDDGGDLHAVCGFQLLLAEILASAEPKPSEDETRWLEQAQAALEIADRVDLLDMESIADRLNMSYVNFRKKFTRLARTSPGKYHSALLMQRACRILMEQKITDRELSQRLGYSDPYYFAQRFQRTIGMTPRQFRRSMMGNARAR